MGAAIRIKDKIAWHWRALIKHHYPYLWSRKLYKQQFGHRANYAKPNDLNEKILWLMFYTNIDLWSKLADKYAVREYVRERIGDEYLVPLLGVWDNADAIDFDKLPDKFVLKPNNGSYDCIICDDKSQLDISATREKLRYSLNHKFGYENAEPHYLKIKPVIVAEELIESESPQGLIDYKIWCFNGKPYCFLVCVDRDPVHHHADFLYYDLDWNRHPEFVAADFRTDKQCPKPQNLGKMLEIASKLSAGLPQVRVDLYNVDGKIYFGEMTLSSNYGMMPYYTQETLNAMGKECILPVRSTAEKLSSFRNRWFPIFI